MKNKISSNINVDKAEKEKTQIMENSNPITSMTKNCIKKSMKVIIIKRKASFALKNPLTKN